MDAKEKVDGAAERLSAFEERFLEVMEAMTRAAYETARSKGWWPEDQEVNHGEQIALMHSELSEGLEYQRHGNGKSDHIPEFTGMEEELADVVIRIMSYAGRTNQRIWPALVHKMRFNHSRPNRHGGKLF